MSLAEGAGSYRLGLAADPFALSLEAQARYRFAPWLYGFIEAKGRRRWHDGGFEGLAVAGVGGTF